MAHIFKHKESGKLYTIEYLKKDMRHLNAGAFEGIYATPYKWEGSKITHTRQQLINMEIEDYNPVKFVDDNFEIVGELL